ncbi:MAG: helix-turn-helix domain-containing protein [Solidesulfovibrio sp. DCME]|uniref:helix-turn-helix domain-containing protein n=1 Tax=unclassified Solidesulfovibrio TaxID=2910989 RepID=UPI002B20F1CC|nr:helix-turn-helix domain-containing protein [Solidesulfovibrio sp.]MEA4856057.1 helix-turn-helix domain-containing protein [Solidesulfovibrio sp.]
MKDSPEGQEPIGLTLKEAAAMLRVHENTLAKLLQDGRVRGVKIGREWRTSKKALEDFVDGQGPRPLAEDEE